MKKVKILLSFILLIPLASGCSTKVYEHSLFWKKEGTIYNIQYADKAILISDHVFRVELEQDRSTKYIKTGNIADCLYQGLKESGEFGTYAILKEQDKNMLPPQAKVIRIVPKDVKLKNNIWKTSTIGVVTATVIIDGVEKEIESEGKGAFLISKDALSKACENFGKELKKTLNQEKK
ncbi:MAG: hypothetical protein HPY60_11020 [Candidatus Methanofastidiosum sp.]|nr:hypothetical protein [Methanofastidiosum sp.]